MKFSRKIADSCLDFSHHPNAIDAPIICCFSQIPHKNVEKWLSVYALGPTPSINHAIISSHQFFPPPKPQNLPPPFLSAQISETHIFFSRISRQKTGFLRWIRPQESCFGAEEQSHGFEFHG